MRLLSVKILILLSIGVACTKGDPSSKSTPIVTPAASTKSDKVTTKSKLKGSDFGSPVDVGLQPKVKAKKSRLKLVWMSLDGFQPRALEPWISKLKKPHPKGLAWLLKQARGRDDLRVINPTITAPSHIATITCSPAGSHGVLDNSAWTGNGTVSGFGKAYSPENWISRLRRHGLRVGVAFYPSIDWSADSRSADLGIAYDTAGSSTQMMTLSRLAAVDVIIPARSTADKSFTLRLSADAKGNVTGSTPWGNLPPLKVAKPHDFIFKIKVDGTERTAAVSVMLVSGGEKSLVAVSPVQMMPAFDEDFRAWIDRENIFFSSLKDYKMQTNVPAYLAAMKHRQEDIVKINLTLLKREDLDALFLYFPDLDSLLHGFYRDSANERHVIRYLARFDREIGKILSAVPSSADLVVLGDHGMSAIGYSLNARKLLGEDVASKGHLTTSGGAMYLYPPTGPLDANPPSDLNLNQIAKKLRSLEFDVTKQKIFAKVLVRGTQDALDEGLGGDEMPWIMAFANDGIGLKNSVEDRFLLSKATWATIPKALASKYPSTFNSSVLDRPVPAGQHGHYNGLAQMRTRLVMMGPRLSKIPLSKVDRTLRLVPNVADAEGWPRPSGCPK
jgi:predicted AlkP superfamily pyrophosphatase or phosphodiesterase